MRMLCVAFFCIARMASAGHEGQPVTSGPITALDQLTSLKINKQLQEESARKINIQQWQTSKGMRVYFVQANELPMLKMRVIFDAGAARDGEMQGLASTVSRLLDEGTSTQSADDIAKKLENIGARFSASSYRDMALVDVEVLSQDQYRKPAIDIFADILTHAQFAQEALERIEKSSEVGQQQQQQSPAALASRTFYKELYGAHPYANPPSGVLESLKRIKREHLLSFYQRYYVAKNAVLLMVGDVSKNQAEKISKQLDQSMQAGEVASILPEVNQLTQSKEVHREFPSAQTHILVGSPGLRYGDPDYYAITVGNEILGGGGFDSKLMKELRQKRGLTYGVNSVFSSMRQQGPFMINLSTRADQAQEARQLIADVLNDFMKNGPSEEEILTAKNSIMGSFPLALASNESIMGFLGMIGFYRLDSNYLNDYTQKVNAVTTEDIRAAFKRHIDVDKLLTVSVGKK
jgi:zinc protease